MSDKSVDTQEVDKKKGGGLIWKLVILVAVLGAIVAVYFLTPLRTWITWENIQANLGQLQSFVEQNYLAVALIYMGAYALSTAFSLPIGLYLTITGGILFGWIFGGLFVVIGATLGATALFFVVRYAIGDSIQKKYEKQLANFQKQIDENGMWFFLSIRLMFFLPFFVINLLAGLTNVKARTYILTTLVGIIPGTLAYSFLGSSISDLTQQDGFSLPWELLAGLTLLAIISLLPIFLKRKRLWRPL
jgi:uncharacterized membrane protein YdjX (TVP38/TMEM64 family)